MDTDAASPPRPPVAGAGTGGQPCAPPVPVPVTAARSNTVAPGPSTDVGTGANEADAPAPAPAHEDMDVDNGTGDASPENAAEATMMQHFENFQRAWALGEQYTESEEFEKAEEFLAYAAELAPLLTGETSEETALCVNNLAMHYYLDVHNLEKALPHLKRLVPLTEAALGKDHPHHAVALRNYASALEQAGNFTAAEAPALAHCEATLAVYGEQTEKYARSLSDLAVLCRKLGQFTRAERLLKRAMAIASSLEGSEQFQALLTNNLANLAISTGDNEKATVLLQKAAALEKALTGEGSARWCVTCSNLCIAYQNTGQVDKALTLLKRVLQRRKELFGEPHPKVANTLCTLSSLHTDAGDFEAAEEAGKAAVVMFTQLFGEDHVDTATSMNNLAVIYLDQGDADRAVPMFEKCLAIRIAAYGSDHPEVAKIRVNLSKALQVSSRAANRPTSRAVEELTEAVAMHKRRSNGGKLHPDCIGSMARLGQLYSSEGDHDKAVAAFEEALAACDASDVAAVHPLRAFILSRYGACTQDLARAEKYLLQAQAMYRELKWGDESAFASIESHLGQVALLKGDLEKAESLISEALRKQTKLLGRVHPDRGTTLSWLARVRYERGDLSGQEEALRECMVSCGGIVDADTVSALVGLRDRLLAKRTPESLEESMGIALQICQSRERTHGCCSDEYAAAMYRAGVIAQASGTFMDAERYYGMALGAGSFREVTRPDAPRRTLSGAASDPNAESGRDGTAAGAASDGDAMSAPGASRGGDHSCVNSDAHRDGDCSDSDDADTLRVPRKSFMGAKAAARLSALYVATHRFEEARDVAFRCIDHYPFEWGSDDARTMQRVREWRPMFDAVEHLVNIAVREVDPDLVQGVLTRAAAVLQGALRDLVTARPSAAADGDTAATSGMGAGAGAGASAGVAGGHTSGSGDGAIDAGVLACYWAFHTHLYCAAARLQCLQDRPAAAEAVLLGCCVDTPPLATMQALADARVASLQSAKAPAVEPSQLSEEATVWLAYIAEQHHGDVQRAEGLLKKLVASAALGTGGAGRGVVTHREALSALIGLYERAVSASPAADAATSGGGGGGTIPSGTAASDTEASQQDLGQPPSQDQGGESADQQTAGTTSSLRVLYERRLAAARRELAQLAGRAAGARH